MLAYLHFYNLIILSSRTASTWRTEQKNFAGNEAGRSLFLRNKLLCFSPLISRKFVFREYQTAQATG